MRYNFIIIHLSALTLVAEVVSASSSIAWWALGTGAAVLVRGFPDPVPPRNRAQVQHEFGNDCKICTFD